MKHFFILSLIVLLTAGCSKDEITGITGEFSGTYYKISSRGSFDDISDWYNSPTSWPNSRAVVTVTLSESAGTMKIVIDSDIVRKRISGPYSVNNGVYECEGVCISDGKLTYLIRNIGGRDYINNTGQIYGEYLVAYQ